MRKLWDLIALVAGIFFAAQSSWAAVAVYNDCCLHGCEGMAQCANPTCQICQAATAAPAPAEPLQFHSPHQAAPAAAPLPPYMVMEDIWSPPD